LTLADPQRVFHRILVGVDASEASAEACRQAVRLVEPSGRIELVAVVHVAQAAHAGFLSSHAARELEQEAAAALERARALAGADAGHHLLSGAPETCLSGAIADLGATLVAVGTHERRRAAGIVLGGVTATMLHEAPCSVLVARAPADADGFPRSVTVGIDGSEPSLQALEVARALARRLDVTLQVLVALGGKGVDLERAQTAAPDLESVEAKPLEALVEAGAHTDLLVVGSRGLSGLRALGSVSERAAHQAASAVLVVRPPR
jgi:nucleotide-binding universal stress UspA family protein